MSQFGGSGTYSGAGVVPSQNQQILGSGYGERVLAPQEVQEQYRGLLPHFDSNRGVFYDGQFAYIYQAPAQGYGSGGLSLEEGFIQTGVERSIQLGNGTEGNLEEHANHPSSAYLLDREPIAQYH